MSEIFFNLPINGQKEILAESAIQLNRDQILLEKDIWLCWVLGALFEIPNHHPMAFKGGTSLSKVFNAIERFSEDVDISIDYRSFKDEFDPFLGDVSRNAVKKFTERLRGYVLQYSNDIIRPHFEGRLKMLSISKKCSVKVSEDGEKVWIIYPSVVDDHDSLYGYMTNDIMIELGGRNIIDPNERHLVSPDIAALNFNCKLPSADVIVLSPKKTFWEKVTLIHVQSNRETYKESGERLSRHWYDLLKLANHESGKAAIKERELLESVVKYQKVFYKASYAKGIIYLSHNFS